MSYVLVSKDHKVVSAPFIVPKGKSYQAPEGYRLAHAEKALARAAVALAAVRLAGHTGVSRKQLVWALVDSARLVLLGEGYQERLTREQVKTFSSPLYAAANAVLNGGKPNEDSALTLNGSHWGFALRIFRCTAGYLRLDISGEEILTNEARDKKFAALRERSPIAV